MWSSEIDESSPPSSVVDISVPSSENSSSGGSRGSRLAIYCPSSFMSYQNEHELAMCSLVCAFALFVIYFLALALASAKYWSLPLIDLTGRGQKKGAWADIRGQ